MTDKRVLAPEVVNLDSRPENQSVSYVGMVMFLASWAMMFAALFFSYGVLRSRFSVWPPVGTPELPLLLPALNTLVIVASSVTMHLGLRGLRNGSISHFRRGLLATIALGIVFTALQVHVWTGLWDAGLHHDSGVFGSIFYLLTVFHFLHVVVGLGLLIALVAPALRAEPLAPRRVPVKLASMFWHFVDIVWVLMFLSVYVV